MTGARTITLTLTRGQYDALAIAASEGADSPDLAAARDALEQAWADARRRGWVPVPPNTLLAAVRALRTAARSAATDDGATWREIADRIARRLDRRGWGDLIGPDPERTPE